MKISILLPVFNTAGFLPECLDSILAQSETDWEVLAVDDFSTDASRQVLDGYAQVDSRIKVFKNEKKGIAPALKLAFENSTGELVSRMDSDDVMASQKLELLKELLLQNGTGHVATGMVEYFSANGIGDGFRKYASWLNGIAQQQRQWTEAYKECPVPSPCWMAWRSDLLACGAFAEEEVYPEDYDLCFRWRQAGMPVVASQQVLHKWRDRPDRASRTDPNYRDNSFLKLKVDWFLKSDHDPQRPLVVWGAGKKGKRLARLLNERGVPFGWVSNNAEKIGKEIRGVELRHFDIVAQLTNPQVIVAVAAPDDQKEILAFMENNNFEPGNHFYFFC